VIRNLVGRFLEYQGDVLVRLDPAARKRKSVTSSKPLLHNNNNDLTMVEAPAISHSRNEGGDRKTWSVTVTDAKSWKAYEALDVENGE
jgi:hypothetical protein